MNDAGHKEDRTELGYSLNDAGHNEDRTELGVALAPSLAGLSELTSAANLVAWLVGWIILAVEKVEIQLGLVTLKG
jgi:hypothetical protein